MLLPAPRGSPQLPAVPRGSPRLPAAPRGSPARFHRGSSFSSSPRLSAASRGSPRRPAAPSGSPFYRSSPRLIPAPRDSTDLCCILASPGLPGVSLDFPRALPGFFPGSFKLHPPVWRCPPSGISSIKCNTRAFGDVCIYLCFWPSEALLLPIAKTIRIPILSLLLA